jgi:biopolymer transport protein ExbD
MHRMRRCREKWSNDGGVDLAVIITPMLDMAFQLLAFFIMTYHPSTAEGAVDGTLLPAATVKGAPGKIATVQILVHAGPAGQPSAIHLTCPEVNIPWHKDLPASDDPKLDFEMALKELAGELAVSKIRTDGMNVPVLVQGDRALRYGYLITVRDVAAAAGFTKIELGAAGEAGAGR